MDAKVLSKIADPSQPIQPICARSPYLDRTVRRPSAFPEWPPSARAACPNAGNPVWPTCTLPLCAFPVTLASPAKNARQKRTVSSRLFLAKHSPTRRRPSSTRPPSYRRSPLVAAWISDSPGSIAKRGVQRLVALAHPADVVHHVGLATVGIRVLVQWRQVPDLLVN